MQQHPVPQNISSYEFKLVGDMTLKQFFQLAGGAVVSLIFYASSLPAIIKWPFVLFFALLGAGLAFLPFEERPLSAWIIAFFKAIYSPTKYVWAQDGAEEVFPKDSSTPQPVIITPQGAEKAEEYLSQIPGNNLVPSLEKEETVFMSKISELFQTVPSPTPSVFPPPPSSPPAIMRVEEVDVPLQTPTKVQPTPVFTRPEPQIPRIYYGAQPVISPFPQPAKQQQGFVAQATFVPAAAPPSPPETPNTVVGQVLTREGKIVAGAILEIRDANQMPVRALRSNQVGHFMAVTPLANGEYEILTEKDGVFFDPVRFKAEGNIIPPIQIKSK